MTTTIATADTVRFTLPKLPYALDALAPQISEESMQYHYGKHLQTYIDNLNRLIVGTCFENASLENIVRHADGPLFNNAAQTWNHIFYFLALSPNPKSVPTGQLGTAIDRAFESFGRFKEELSQVAVSLFGSGWAWLVEDKSGKLAIVGRSNAGNPLTDGMRPLLAIDVWEHAYYIDYRNRRADAVKALWERIDWRVVEERYR